MNLFTFLATFQWHPLQVIVLAAVAVIILMAVVAFRFNYRTQMRSTYYMDTECNVFNDKGLARYLSDRKKKFEKPSLVIVDIRNLIIVSKHHNDPERLIYDISDILLKGLSKIETLGRVEYNRFCIVYDNKDKEQIKSLCKSIEERINNSKETLKNDVDFILRFGVYQNVDLEDTNFAIKNALYTLVYSKDVDNNIYFYSNDVSEILSKEKKITEQMHAALEQNRFVPYIQPKVSLKTGRVSGGEILCRWVDDAQNPIFFPNEFIPLFESNGFVKQVDMLMLENACRLAKTLVDRGHRNLVISVNLSKANFDSPDFASKIETIANKVGVMPSNIEIEITETTIMNSYGYVSKCIMDLRQRGFKVAMDDFGKEYSSLGSLSDNPFDTIKLDGIFFRDNLSTEKTRGIVEDLINMLSKLNYEIVCEGVETKDTLSVIGRITNDVVIQGYYFSKPIPIHQFESFLNTNYDDLIAEIVVEKKEYEKARPVAQARTRAIDSDVPESELSDLQSQIKEMQKTIEDQKKLAYEQEIRFMREQIELLKNQKAEAPEPKESEVERLRRELAEAKKAEEKRKKAKAEALEVARLRKELEKLRAQAEEDENVEIEYVDEDGNPVEISPDDEIIEVEEIEVPADEETVEEVEEVQEPEALEATEEVEEPQEEPEALEPEAEEAPQEEASEPVEEPAAQEEVQEEKPKKKIIKKKAE